MKFRHLSAIFSVIGAGFLLWGLYEYDRTSAFLDVAVSVPGEVTRMREIGGSDGPTYRPVIRYTDHAGKQRDYEPGFSTSPPAYFEGEKLELLYDPTDPRFPLTVRINDGLGLWFRAAGLAGLGIFFLIVVAVTGYIYRKGGVVTFGKQPESPRDGYDF